MSLSGAGEGDLEVVIESEDGAKLENAVRQLQAGRFTVEFQPTRVGRHKTTVRFNELHVPGATSESKNCIHNEML